MKILKTIILTIIFVLVTVCAFGGGFFIWVLIALIIKPNPKVFEIGLYIFTFAPIPFCFWIAPKLAEKYF